MHTSVFKGIGKREEMYADTDSLFPYFQNFSQGFQQLDQFCHTQKSDALLDSSILEYDMGGEGDLFNAPEPILEETITTLDPMPSSISMISCDNEVISSEAIRVADIESTNEQLLSEVFYECNKDLLANFAIETQVPDVFSINIPNEKVTSGDGKIEEGKLVSDVIQKSVSSDCLSSMGCVNASRPDFMDSLGIDFGSVYGMRRAFSEGDIKTLGNDDTPRLIHSPLEQPLAITNYISEERMQKLNRYRNKKSKRNFGRKIKYACRKALADSQPRIRGRFAKTD